MKNLKCQFCQKYKFLLLCILPFLLGCGEDGAPYIEMYFKIDRHGLRKIMLSALGNVIDMGHKEILNTNRFSIFNNRASKINVLAMEKDMQLDDSLLTVYFNMVFLMSILVNKDADEEIKEKIINLFALFAGNKDDGEVDGKWIGSGANRNFRLFQVRIDLDRFMTQITSVSLEVGNKKYPFKRTSEEGVWQIDLISIINNKNVQYYALKNINFLNFAEISTLRDYLSTVPQIPLYINVNYIQW